MALERVQKVMAEQGMCLSLIHILPLFRAMNVKQPFRSIRRLYRPSVTENTKKFRRARKARRNGLCSGFCLAVQLLQQLG